MKMSVDQALRKARTLAGSGDVGSAEAIYREILDRFPANKRVRAELDALNAPQLVNPSTAEMDALIALYRAGDLGAALAAADALVARFPNGEILRNIAGAINAAAGRPDAALAHYDQAIALAPDYPEAHNNRGNALNGLGRADEALASFDAALRLKPDYADAHMNRGIALAALQRLDAALASHDRAIALGLGRAEAYNNRGTVFQALCRPEDALADYDKALRLVPGYAEAHANRGNALKLLRRPQEALASYDRALALSPRLADAHHNRGLLLREARRLDEALAAHEAAVAWRPGHASARAYAVYLRAQMCLWEPSDPRLAALLGLVDEGAAIPPFHFLNLIDDPARQLSCARTLSRGQFPVARPALPRTGPSGDKIRIGYFSADFHNHATMYLMARLFELHDRSRFEIHAFSYGPDVEDEMRVRLRNAVDGFHDVTSLGDAEVAALSRHVRIDLAIDLKGHTESTRLGIFAQRAAPVQASYLGYAGSLGTDFIDYVIADPVTIPVGHERHYSESVARLPHCYQVNDDRRVISERQFRRAELGLPDDGFVFACFNNNFKITSIEFDIWMRLLTQVEGSVLWLLQDNMWAAANLRREAQARGIDPERIVFGGRMSLSEHLARQGCADLFLDTFKVNAHTTASDALWAGLPVVTKIGESFVSRVAASLLQAIDMPDLVTRTPQAYEALALALATDPARIADVRARLVANRLTTPLFDTKRFARDMESLYESLVSA